MKPTITAIIAHMPLGLDLLKMTRKCISDFKPLVDKMIVVQNGTYQTWTDADEEIMLMADHYLINKNNRLHGGAINQGAVLARPGEYLAFINDDIYAGELNSRELMEKLCIPGTIMSPRIGDQEHGYGAHASFFVCDYETFHRVGWWDLTFGHVADENWFKRARDLGIPMNYIPYKVIHDHPAATISRVTPPKFEKGEY